MSSLCSYTQVRLTPTPKGSDEYHYYNDVLHRLVGHLLELGSPLVEKAVNYLHCLDDEDKHWIFQCQEHYVQFIWPWDENHIPRKHIVIDLIPYHESLPPDIGITLHRPTSGDEVSKDHIIIAFQIANSAVGDTAINVICAYPACSQVFSWGEQVLEKAYYFKVKNGVL